MPTSTLNYGFLKPNVNSPDDEDLWGEQLNSNFDLLDTLLNALIPIGQSVVYRGGSVPSAYFMIEDGSAISRTTYAALFTVISTTYGIGDGATTFNIPDSRARVDVGTDGGTGRLTTLVSGVDGATLGATGGDQRVQTHTHVATAAPHNHAFNSQNATSGGGGGWSLSNGNDAGGTGLTGFNGNAINNTTVTVTNANYGAGSSQNVQPTLVATKMIRVM